MLNDVEKQSKKIKETTEAVDFSQNPENFARDREFLAQADQQKDEAGETDFKNVEKELSGAEDEHASEEKIKKEYGVVEGTFRGKWWDYYERGLSFAEGGYFKEAIEDLNVAIGKKENDELDARAGQRFIDYYPNRELGIIYFKLREFDKAKHHLSLSIKECPTPRAEQYLEEIRKGEATKVK